MKVTVFEDPCPKPGQSVQELIARMLRKPKNKKHHEESSK